MTCRDWLIRSGFHESDIAENIRLASLREKENDVTAFFWAVIYAQVLIAFPALISNRGPWTPDYFCDQQKLFSLMEFEDFKSKKTTCELWIGLYTYKYANPFYNFDVAQPRNETEDESISLWATIYAMFLTSIKRNKAIRIQEFCLGVLRSFRIMGFMSLNDKPLNCKQWIYLYGFDDNVNRNIYKTKKGLKTFQKYKQFINHWARYYIEELLKLEKKPNIFGCGSSTSIMASECTENERMKPSEFCIDRGFPDDVRVKYFG